MELYYDDSFLEHYGIRGQKWGVRRYQNSDGSLTNAGKARYSLNAAAKKHPDYEKAVKATARSLEAHEKWYWNRDASKDQAYAADLRKAEEAEDRVVTALINKVAKRSYSSYAEGFDDPGSGVDYFIGKLAGAALKEIPNYLEYEKQWHASQKL